MGVVLSDTTFVTGPLKWIWIKLVANEVAKSSAQQMDSLVSLARKKTYEKSSL